MPCGIAGYLGAAVKIIDFRCREGALQAVRQNRRQRFAAGHNMPQGVRSPLSSFRHGGKFTQQARHRHKPRDFFGLQNFIQRIHMGDAFFLHEKHGEAIKQRPENFAKAVAECHVRLGASLVLHGWRH